MKKIAFLLLLLATAFSIDAASIIRNAAPADTSQWICFRKVINVSGNTTKNEVRIAADSKYWIWVNGELEVFEGALKRGPNPKDTYVDVLSLKNLKPGDNTIAVLVWYFGRPGFSHRSSNCPGLYLDLTVGGKHYGTDASWRTTMHPAYYLPSGELPNFRLPESNIGFDARKDIADFYKTDFNEAGWQQAIEVSNTDADWNNLVERPIPMWKDYGLKHYLSQERQGNKIICHMPYNAQVTPYLKVRGKAGQVIDIRTDDYYGGGTTSVRAEYITRDGEQEYENLGWMNGHDVIYTVPDGVEVLDLAYRETGFNCTFDGKFVCNDPRMNSLWTKSQRTLYITMRDTYMDCPDRERAAWIGDITNELVETFYSLSFDGNLLTRKCIRELADWQKPDSVMYAPVPAGNWDKELPMQTMASIGLGSWNYYMGTADKQTIADIFPAAKRYMHKWVIQSDSLVTYRTGAWDWGDWGHDADMQAMCQLWYAITLDTYAKQAELIGQKAEAAWARQTSDNLKKAFHAKFWTGEGYRHNTYKGLTDDRTQALAVLAGVAPKSTYPVLRDFFMKTKLASPYMERYVLEALCEMGYVAEAKERMMDRYKPMIDAPYTTLSEVFPDDAFTGTYNHAWSGGPLIIMSRYIAGVHPIKPGFKEFLVKPQMCDLKTVNTTVPTQYGNIIVQVNKENGYNLSVRVPKGTKAVIQVPAGNYSLNGKKASLKPAKAVAETGALSSASAAGVQNSSNSQAEYVQITVGEGMYNIKAI